MAFLCPHCKTYTCHHQVAANPHRFMAETKDAPCAECGKPYMDKIHESRRLDMELYDRLHANPARLTRQQIKRGYP